MSKVGGFGAVGGKQWGLGMMNMDVSFSARQASF